MPFANGEVGMSKKVQITFCISLELRARFRNVTGAQDRPAAQVLRDFMHAYVREHEHVLANDSLSPAERRRRENAANFARSSVVLEGLVPSKEAEANAGRFIRGEIQLAESVSSM
jgi:predicted DNA-binding protein